MTLVAPVRFVGKHTGSPRLLHFQRKAWVKAQLAKGYRPQGIAAALGITVGSVRKIANWTGEPQRPRNKKISDNLVHDAIPRHVKLWLRRELPAGVSIEEFVASIIIDAYAEEAGL